MKNKLNKDFIINLSKRKNEPSWMLNFRLKAYEKFLELDNPDFGPKIDIDFDKLTYYKGSFNPPSCSWEKIDKNVKNTFDSLGVIDAEKKYLKGVSNKYESEVMGVTKEDGKYNLCLLIDMEAKANNTTSQNN